MPQYNSRREEVVHALIPPSPQQDVWVSAQWPAVSADELTCQLRDGLLTDSWFLEHQQLLTQWDG